ncbi:MAG: hypothetical protein M3Q80_01895 [bacterium]|nr:hypothetical protein [bacterium]
MFTNYKVLEKIHADDIAAFRAIVTISSLVVQYENNNAGYPSFRCHSVCIALAAHIPSVTVVHGTYLGLVRGYKGKVLKTLTPHGYPHSWLTGPKKTIFDVYPVGFISPPCIVPAESDFAPFGAQLFLPDPSRTKEFTSPEIMLEAAILFQHIAELLKK